MSKLKNQNPMFLNEKGISLIEMLIVIAIIGIMVSIIVVAPPNKLQKSVDRAAEQFADDVRKTQSQSVNTKKCNGSVATGGYGIHLLNDNDDNRKKYTIFCDLDQGHDYDSSEKVIEIDLQKDGVMIDSIKKGTSEASAVSAGNNVDVSFEPPYGKTYIYANGSSDTTNNIYVKLKRIGSTCPDPDTTHVCRTITINQQGQVSE